MTRPITLIDLFSGIGGFHAGIERAGYQVDAYYSEIDKHATAIYRKNFPHATALGSVTDVRRDGLPHHIDIITFGSPCQGFSNAGRNGGLSDERSGLVRHAIRLIAECRPRFFIWENVKGAISAQHSADFWAVVQCLANIGGYRLEWQLLNTEWVLPQNRERIYLVGHLTAPNGGFAPIFPFRESDSILGSGIGQGQKRAGERPASAITSTYHKGVHGRGETFIKAPSATASGYEVATEGDSINLTAFGSHTRRARVGHGKAHTIDTGAPQGVMVPTDIGRTLRASGHLTPTDRHNFDCIDVSSQCDQQVLQGPLIRRLTEIECERLQGFPDDWTKLGDYDGTIKEVASTNRYKCLGNAVTVDIVALVGSRLRAGFALWD